MQVARHLENKDAAIHERVGRRIPRLTVLRS
jgi:hypothetical protein